MNSMDDLYQFVGTNGSEGTILLDVRSAEEFSQGHIEGAINLPHDEITEKSLEVLNESSSVKIGRAHV